MQLSHTKRAELRVQLGETVAKPPADDLGLRSPKMHPRRYMQGLGSTADKMPLVKEIISPPMTAKIWRYMDFAKLMSLIDRSALFFPLIKKMPDKLESYSPRY